MAGLRLIASGEIGGTLPATAALINLLNKIKKIPEDNTILELIEKTISCNR